MCLCMTCACAARQLYLFSLRQHVFPLPWCVFHQLGYTDVHVHVYACTYSMHVFYFSSAEAIAVAYMRVAHLQKWAVSVGEVYIYMYM